MVRSRIDQGDARVWSEWARGALCGIKCSRRRAHVSPLDPEGRLLKALGWDAVAPRRSVHRKRLRTTLQGLERAVQPATVSRTGF